MELLSVFIILLAIGLIIIQIMMIVKFFEIAADIRSIKDTILKHVSTNSVPEHIHQAISPIVTDSPVDNVKQDGEKGTGQLDKGPSGWTFGIILLVIGVIVFILFSIYLSQK